MAGRTEKKIDINEIRSLMHSNAERGWSHTPYDEESRRFHWLMNGDMRAVDEAVRVSKPEMQGTLSSDPLRNMRYLFIVNTGLATRYLIEMGIPQETVYSISDVYIQRADTTKSIAGIEALTRELWTVFVETVAEHRAGKNYSAPIYAGLNYIDSHFNEKITLADLSELTGMNSSYLAELFHRETGVTFGQYLMNIRIETAKALLTKTAHSYSKIALSLGFCSQSHFSAAFKRHTGYTPNQYRRQFYNANITGVY